MTFRQAAEAHLDDVYGYLAWFTGDRFAAEDLDRRDVRARAAALAPLRPAPRLGAHLALPGGAHGRARPLPLRAAARAARGARRAAGARSTSASPRDCRPTSSRRSPRLTAGEREVVALRVVLDLDAGAAARVLGISPTNCTTRLNRALKKLEEALHVAA